MFPDFDFASVFDSLKYVFSATRILTSALIDLFIKLFDIAVGVFKYINSFPNK